MTYMTNHELAWKAATHIIAHPELFNPRTWSSYDSDVRGFSGWVAHFAGWERIPSDDPDMLYDDYAMQKAGDIMPIPAIAARELGLGNPELRWALDSSELTITDICGVLITWARRDGVDEYLPGAIRDAYMAGCADAARRLS